MKTAATTTIRTITTTDGERLDLVKITTRCRSLGYGWTTQPMRDRAAIVPVTTPDVTGGLRTVEAARAEHQRAVSGGTWSNAALFVGGRRVRDDISQVLAELRQSGEALAYVVAG